MVLTLFAVAVLVGAALLGILDILHPLLAVIIGLLTIGALVTLWWPDPSGTRPSLLIFLAKAAIAVGAVILVLALVIRWTANIGDAENAFDERVEDEAEERDSTTTTTSTSTTSTTEPPTTTTSTTAQPPPPTTIVTAPPPTVVYVEVPAPPPPVVYRQAPPAPRASSAPASSPPQYEQAPPSSDTADFDCPYGYVPQYNPPGCVPLTSERYAGGVG